MIDRMTPLHEIARLANEVATQHGFDLPTWENLPIKLMFVVTELDEAQEVMDTHKAPHEIHMELADIALRTLAMLNGLWGETWSADRIAQRSMKTQAPLPFERPETLLWPILHQLREAVGCWRMDDRRDTMICLELALLALWRLSDRLGQDLNADIALKLRLNKSRPMLHGKKRSEA